MNIKHIDILKKAISKNYRCDESHNSLAALEASINKLAEEFSKLPDEIKFSATIDPLAKVILELND